MITNQLLYQLSYTGLALDNTSKRKRKYYKIIFDCASLKSEKISGNYKMYCLNKKINVDDCLTKRLPY